MIAPHTHYPISQESLPDNFLITIIIYKDYFVHLHGEYHSHIQRRFFTNWNATCQSEEKRHRDKVVIWLWHQKWNRDEKKLASSTSLLSPSPIKMFFCSENFSSSSKTSYGVTLIKNSMQAVEFRRCEEDQAEHLDHG